MWKTYNTSIRPNISPRLIGLDIFPITTLHSPQYQHPPAHDVYLSVARWPGSVAHRVMNHETRLSTEDKTFTVFPWTPWQCNMRPQLGNYVIDTPTLHNIGGSVNLCATDRCIPPQMNDSTSLSRQQPRISVIQAKKERKKKEVKSMFVVWIKLIMKQND